MAIAADFLSAPKFDMNTTSFLAGKVATAMQNRVGISDSDRAVNLLGSEGRYSGNVASRLGADGSKIVFRRDSLGYDQIARVKSATSAQNKIALELMPQDLKLDPTLLATLKRVSDVDVDSIFNDVFGGFDQGQHDANMAHLRTQIGEWTVPNEKLLSMYREMARINSVPTLMFVKPRVGKSGTPGTMGTGYKGLQAGFSDRLLALIADVRKRGGKIDVGGGWRSLADQERLKRQKPNLAATPGRSNHGWGLASDLTYGSAQSRALAHQLAPLYGLRFPMSWENWHIEPASIKAISVDGRIYESTPFDIEQTFATLARRLMAS